MTLSGLKIEKTNSNGKGKLGNAEDANPDTLFTGGNVDMVSLRSILLFGLRGMAAYAWHAYILAKRIKK